MRVYVAGKYGPKTNERVRSIQERLREAGHVITYDWTRQDQVTVDQAEADYTGIRNADAFVLVAEEEDVTYTGSLVELGMAIAFGIRVYVIGAALTFNRPKQGMCIFMLLPNLHGEAAFDSEMLTPVATTAEAAR